MNEEEFFRKYMNPESGIYKMSRVMGRKAGERDIVGSYLARIHNAKNTGIDFFLPDNEKEYKPMRDEALTALYGKGFVDMYDKYKPMGEGAYGAVFEKPGDPQRILKVQRQDTINRQQFGDNEIQRQLEAVEMGVAPRIHSVTNLPYKHEVPMEILRSFDNRYGTVDPRHQVTEMDRINTLGQLGGKDVVLQNYVKNLNNNENSEELKKENQKYRLAVSKAQLQLADRGIVHTDLGTDRYKDPRQDHTVYDPSTNKLQFIDYGHTEKYNHANNLHEHTKNMNLKDEELRNYTPGAQAEHFLEHKVANIVNGMKAVGNIEEANIFQGLYGDVIDSGDLLAADDLVNQGRDIIRRHSFKDVR